MTDRDVSSETEQVAHNANLRRLLEIERGAREISEATSSDQLRKLGTMVSELARVSGDVAQSVPPVSEQRSHVEAHGDLERRLAALENDSPVEASILEPGAEYELTLRVRATVLERHDDRGLCYKLQLDGRDYVLPRVVDLDADEISGASLRS